MPRHYSALARFRATQRWRDRYDDLRETAKNHPLCVSTVQTIVLERPRPRAIKNVSAPYYAWIDGHLSTRYDLKELRLAKNTDVEDVDPLHVLTTDSDTESANVRHRFDQLVQTWNTQRGALTWGLIKESTHLVNTWTGQHQVWRPLYDALSHVYDRAVRKFPDKDIDDMPIGQHFVHRQPVSDNTQLSFFKRYDKFVRAVFLLLRSLELKDDTQLPIHVSVRMLVTAPSIYLFAYRMAHTATPINSTSDLCTRYVEVIDNVVHSQGLNDYDETPLYDKSDNQKPPRRGTADPKQRLGAERRELHPNTTRIINPTKLHRRGYNRMLKKLGMCPYADLTWARLVKEYKYDLSLVTENPVSGLAFRESMPSDARVLENGFLKSVTRAPGNSFDAEGKPVERVILPSPITRILHSYENVLASLNLSTYLTIPYVKNINSSREGWVLNTETGRLCTGFECARLKGIKWSDVCAFHLLGYVHDIHDSHLNRQSTQFLSPENNDWDDMKRKTFLDTVATYFMNEVKLVEGTDKPYGFHAVRAIWYDVRLVNAWPVPPLRLFTLSNYDSSILVTVTDGKGDVRRPVESRKRIRGNEDGRDDSSSSKRKYADGGGGEERIQHVKVTTEFVIPIQKDSNITLRIDPLLFFTLTCVRLSHDVRSWYMQELYDQDMVTTLNACHPLLNDRYVRKMPLAPFASTKVKETEYVQSVLRSTGHLRSKGRAVFEAWYKDLWVDGKSKFDTYRKPEEINLASTIEVNI